MAEELQGERVLLRRYSPADAPALHEAIVESREHLRPWESFADAFQTLEATQDWIIRSTASWLLRERFSLPWCPPTHASLQCLLTVRAAIVYRH
jgi:hypothetical protein